MTDTEAEPEADPDPGTDPDEHAPRHDGPTIARHPGDVARLIVALLIALLALALQTTAETFVVDVAEDVAQIFDWLPDSVSRALIGLLQLAAVGLPIAAIVTTLVHRQYRFLLTAMLGAAIGAGMAGTANALVNADFLAEVATRLRAESFFAGAAFPSTTYLAAAAGAVAASGPWSTREWRRAVWWVIAFAVAVRIVTSTGEAGNLALTLSLGAAGGYLAVIGFGGPMRRPGTDSVFEALERAGLDPRSVTFDDAALILGTRFQCETGAGETLDVRVLDHDDRDADLLRRMWRGLRVKGLEDTQPPVNPRRDLEREATMLAIARHAGVRVPEAVMVTDAPDGMSLLATISPGGHTLAEIEPDADTLTAAWQLVGRLQDHRLAHRWLTLANLRVDPAGQVWLDELHFAEEAAEDRLLSLDVAELLTSSALAVGVPDAVGPAVAALGPDRVAAALPYLQALALTTQTRSALKDHKAVLTDLRTEVQAATGADDVELAKLERVSIRQVLMVVATIAVFAILLGQISEADDLWGALKGANWVLIPVVIAVGFLTYVFGAICLAGAVPQPIPFVGNCTLQLAQTFLNRFTPANAGGMALRIRWLQLRGVEGGGAVASVGLTSAASGVMQVVLIVVAFAWVGASSNDSDATSFSLPSVSDLALLALGVSAVLGLGYLTPWGRKILLKGWEILLEGVRVVEQVGKSPTKLVQLFGGATGSKLANVVAFWLTMIAFGVHEPFSTTLALYLTATTVASAVPTPGGVGPLEAAMIAGLTGIGVDANEAVSIVLVFRLATYWLPVLPSYLALQVITKRGEV